MLFSVCASVLRERETYHVRALTECAARSCLRASFGLLPCDQQRFRDQRAPRNTQHQSSTHPTETHPTETHCTDRPTALTVFRFISLAFCTPAAVPAQSPSPSAAAQRAARGASRSRRQVAVA